MHMLVTAGNTQAPIDRVRCITNIFSGRTGASIAVRAWERGHTVTVFTSHPDSVTAWPGATPPTQRWDVTTFRTFDDLLNLMAERIPRAGFDAVIHCAAVSDFLVDGAYEAAEGTSVDSATGRWNVRTTPALCAGKIKSDAPELWLRLFRAPKLIDMIRAPWGFGGVLVKFKLEVDTADEALLDIAERSRRQSNADLMVANTLDSVAQKAYLGPLRGGYERVNRAELADRLLKEVESLHGRR